MALTSAEKQRRYRERHLGAQGSKEERIRCSSLPCRPRRNSDGLRAISVTQ
jgi:hypothetical protein